MGMLIIIKQWCRKRDGVTAVEFSLLALPLIVMVIGIIEISLMFTTQSLLDASTATAARLIRTGQVQQDGGNEEMFREALCDFAEILIPCDDIQLQVQVLEDFGSAEETPPPEFDEEGNLEGQGFAAGDINSVILIRAVYQYSIMTPLMQPVLTNRADGTRLMISTIVLQNEPYEFEEEE